MIVHIDSQSALPVFEQLRSQIERLISSGQLRPGTKLTPIRQLANDLGLARGTVNKVYDALAAAADTLALVVRQLGLDNTAAHAALDDALRRF